MVFKLANTLKIIWNNQSIADHGKNTKAPALAKLVSANRINTLCKTKNISAMPDHVDLMCGS
ncbi:hypothetical protein NSMM_210012 [Nitrosomonas mobilis]|uniref:Uncharacterized protein n=1 Tax=Nitrosomonas mobilis TaxID=51642 RepID=A0A1G5SBI1_9PROT|nr:hypothetical protein NSMM_210012 [Nitrosomonas mobilis]